MKHYCNTDNPQRPCCWAAREKEFAILNKMDDARIAKYGSTSCLNCGREYKIINTDEVHCNGAAPLVDDHRCKDISDTQMWA